MAIAYVSAGTVEFPSGGAASTWTFTVPGGTTTSDLYVFSVTTVASGVSEPSKSQTLTTLATWYTGGGQAYSAGAYAWAPTGTPPSTVTFTFSGAQEGSIGWVRLQSDTSGTLSVAANGSNTSTSASGTAPSITPSVSPTFRVAGVNQASGSQTLTVPSGWTLRADGSRRNGIIITGNSSYTTTTATGTLALNMSSAAGSMQRWQALIASKQAARYCCTDD